MKDRALAEVVRDVGVGVEAENGAPARGPQVQLEAIKKGRWIILVAAIRRKR